MAEGNAPIRMALEALETSGEAIQDGSLASLEGLMPLFWQLSPWLAGLMILRCLPLATQLRDAWRAGRAR